LSHRDIAVDASRIAIPPDRYRSLSRRARAACAVALLVLSACSDDESAIDAGKSDVVATDQNTSSTVDATAGATGATGGPSTTKGPGDGRLGAVLLTADDLPGGWTMVPAADMGDAGDSCLDALGAPGGPFDLSAAPTATFAAGKIGPFLSASVVDRPAGVVLPAVNDILVACDGSKSAQGFTTRVEPASIAGLPEGSLAVHGTDETDSGSGVRYTIAATGTDEATLMVFAVTPLGEIDQTVVAGAVNVMHARLPGS
jgi:hypothetical protein